MDAATLRKMASYPGEFRRQLLVDTDSGPQRFAEVMDDWQRHDFEVMDPGWRKIAGQAVHPPFMRAYLERGRGHSKTTDLSVMAAWALAFAPRNLSIVVGAGDRDQARLLLESMGKLVQLNPWLGMTLDVQQWRAVNPRTGSTLTVLSSDVPTSYGLTPQVVLLDELAIWPRRDLFDSLASAAAKRESVVVAITNAGFVDSWQYKTREAIRSDAAWYFARLDGPVASWITQDRLAEQRRLLPAWQFARLWLNEWTSGVDNPLVSEDDLASAITLPGPMEAFDPERGPYIAGLDIGTRSDRTALVVLGLNLRGPRVQLAAVREWDPSRYGGTLPLSVVERDIVEIAQNAKLHGIVYDPTEAVMLAERLTARGIPMFRYAWSAQKKEKMALYALESFHHRKIDLFDCPALLRDLRRTQVAERAGHMTFTQARDEHGHCDVGSAFLMALTWARVTRADYLGSYDGLPDVGEAA